jgi:hypothetical protein
MLEFTLLAQLEVYLVYRLAIFLTFVCSSLFVSSFTIASESRLRYGKITYLEQILRKEASASTATSNVGSKVEARIMPNPLYDLITYVHYSCRLKPWRT